MIVDLFTQIVQAVFFLVQRIFNAIWGGVDFSVLYSIKNTLNKKKNSLYNLSKKVNNHRPNLL